MLFRSLPTSHGGFCRSSLAQNAEDQQGTTLREGMMMVMQREPLSKKPSKQLTNSELAHQVVRHLTTQYNDEALTTMEVELALSPRGLTQVPFQGRGPTGTERARSSRAAQAAT